MLASWLVPLLPHPASESLRSQNLRWALCSFGVFGFVLFTVCVNSGKKLAFLENREFTHTRNEICFALTYDGNFALTVEPEWDHMLEMSDQDYMETKSETPLSSLPFPIPGIPMFTVSYGSVLVIGICWSGWYWGIMKSLEPMLGGNVQTQSTRYWHSN